MQQRGAQRGVWLGAREAGRTLRLGNTVGQGGEERLGVVRGG